MHGPTSDLMLQTAALHGEHKQQMDGSKARLLLMAEFTHAACVLL